MEAKQLRHLLDTSGLLAFEQNLIEAGLTITKMAELPGPHLAQELAEKIQMRPDDVRKLQENLRAAEHMARVWDDTCARARAPTDTQGSM